MTHKRSWRAVIGLVALAVSACGGGGGAAPSTPTPTAPAWDSIRSHIAADGSVDLPTALSAFALVIGPLPGVSAPSGTTIPFDDATAPVRWVLNHRAELSSSQLSSIQRYLSVSPPGGGPGTVFAPQAASRAHIKQLAMAAESAIRSRIGHPGMSWDIQLDFPSEVPADAQTANGYTDARDASGEWSGVPAICHIHVTPRGAAQDDANLTRTVTHEMFHCYQAAQYGSVSDFSAAPSWVIEGSATWAAGDITGLVPAGWWNIYLTGPETSLFQRTYDAVGFYAHMKEAGDNPWGQFDALYAAARKGDGAALASALNTHAQSFYDTWAPGFIRDSALGAEWDTSGPGITSSKESPALFTLADGQPPAGEALPAAGNSVYSIDLEADVVIINAPQHSRMHSVTGSAVNLTSPRGTYCTKQGGCTCPQGSARQGESLPALAPGTAYLAVSGASSGATWGAFGESLEHFCASDRVDQCLTGTWVQQTFSPIPNTHGLFTFPDPIGITYTFAKSGDVEADFGTMPTITAGDATTKVSITFSGKATAHLTADHGVATVTNADIGSVAFTSTVNGLSLGTHTYAEIFGGDLTHSSTFGFVTYTCSKTQLTLYDAYGDTATLAR